MTTRTTTRMLWSLLLVTALTLTGCGGGGAKDPKTEVLNTGKTAEIAVNPPIIVTPEPTLTSGPAITKGPDAPPAPGETPGAFDRPGDKPPVTTPQPPQTPGDPPKTPPADPDRSGKLEGITKTYASVVGLVKAGLEPGKNKANVSDQAAFEKAVTKLDAVIQKFNGLKAKLEDPNLSKEEFDRLSQEFSATGNEVVEALGEAKKYLQPSPTAGPGPGEKDAAEALSALSGVRIAWNNIADQFDQLKSGAQKQVDNHVGEYTKLRENLVRLTELFDKRKVQFQNTLAEATKLIEGMKKAKTEPEVAALKGQLAELMTKLAGINDAQLKANGVLAGYLK